MKNLSSFLFSHSIVGLFILLVPNLLFAQWGGGEKYPDLKPHSQSLQQWQDMKFGMFVHWGPSVIRGTSSWARGNHPYDFAPRIPINEYDSLYVQFNPVLFDAEEWISVAQHRVSNTLSWLQSITMAFVTGIPGIRIMISCRHLMKGMC